MQILLVVLCGAMCLSCRKETTAPPPSEKPSAAPHRTSSPTSGPSGLRQGVEIVRTELPEPVLDASMWSDAPSATREAATQATQPSLEGIDTHLAAGAGALRRGDNRTAAECFYRAFRLDPSHLGVLYGLSEALVAEQQYDPAVPIHEMILGLAPNDMTARFNLAVMYSRLERYTQAEKAYRQLLAQDETYVQAWYNLAGLLHAQGKLSEAQKAYRQVTARAPHLVSAHSVLAETCVDLGQVEEAMLLYAEVAKLSPQDITAWMNLSVAAQAAGSNGRAIVAMKRASALAPQDAALWADLGHLQLHVHRLTGDKKLLADAVDSWRESLRLDPDRHDLSDWIAAYEAALLEPTSPSTN